MIAVELVETFRIPFYLPHYLALALGAFEREGLEVRTRTAGGGTALLQALAEGQAQVAMGGPIRALEEAGRGLRLLCFADVNRRDGFLLLARQAAPAFRLEALRRARVLLFAAAPTPNLCLREAVGAAGMGPDEVEWIEGVQVPEAVAALRRGEADYMVAFQPAAEALLAAGEAHLALPLARLHDEIAYTAYMTTPAFADAQGEVLIGLAAALGRAQAWLRAHPAREAAAAVQPFLPDIPRPLLEAVVKRYLDLGVWADGPKPLEARYRRLERLLISVGTLSPRGPLPPVWEDRYAEAAVAREV